ncbi:unnamed protein product [Cylicocyclus nassatus]|uniref:Uncharacterized protein n=1 Tax=Cylicocyclus nassatus TaxID=53992 RepID=A0AA36GJT0_CYLNA|nr:unnamed protein product [Cylicocyclus nassatus]
MLVLLLLFSAVFAALRDKAYFFDKLSEVRVEISQCREDADLNMDEQKLNLGVLEWSRFNMHFCCKCARKAKSYHDRKIKDPNYTMVTQSAWQTVDSEDLAKEIARKVIIDIRDETFKEELQRLHVGCALKNRFYLRIFGITAVCLVYQDPVFDIKL